MGFFDSFMATTPHPRPRDAPKAPEIQDNVRDSGQTFIFGKSAPGHQRNKKHQQTACDPIPCFPGHTE